MRNSVVLCMALGLALGACGKKDQNQDAAQQAQPAPVVQQAAPVQAQSQPAAAPQSGQQQIPTPPPMRGAASIAQPLRPDTIIVTQNYACKNDTKFVARFMHNPSQVEITFPGRVPVTLPQQTSGAGFIYQTSQYKLVGQGNDAQWTLTGKAPVDCKVTHGK